MKRKTPCERQYFYLPEEVFTRGQPSPDVAPLRIKTSYEMPPGPNADHWRAWCDNLGADCSPYGEGATEAEAIADLVDQMAEHME